MQHPGHEGQRGGDEYGELADPDHPVHRIARDQKAWLRDYLQELATAAGHDRPTVLAGQLLALHEGAIVLYSAGADPRAPTTAREAAAVLLHQP